MKSDVRLSTRFLVAQNAHQVGLLLTLAGQVPSRRAPVNVALVLDRSGSMEGGPLAAAKDAAARFVSFLTPQDRLSVVVFDDQVRTVFGPAAAGNPDALDRIACLHAGGSTNLSGGWLKGRKLVQQGLVEGANRIVLLTDGQANVGLVEPEQLIGLTRAGAERRVTTTCIGFGPHFNEDLLAPMARSGGGNFWYVESLDRMGPIFEGEIEGLVSLAAQNVEAEVCLTHPSVAGVTFMQDYPVQKTADGYWRVQLGDIYGAFPLELGLTFHVEDVEELGKVELGQVSIEADVVQEAGIEHRSITMPVIANLESDDRIDPSVERTLLRFEAARARQEAVRCADRGDFSGGAAALRQMATRLAPHAGDAQMQEEIRDLDAEADRIELRHYDASDRKYHLACSVAASRSRDDYVRKARRR